MSFLEKMANVLDLLADGYEAAPEAEEAPDSTEDSLGKFAEAYQDATGSELDDELRDRLQSEPALRTAILKMAEHAVRRPTPLGEAADSAKGPDESRSKSKEAAERNAYDRFAQGIIAIGQR
jgi:hypothetical protein